MAERLDDRHALIRLKVWKEEQGEERFRLHLVSADEDIPNNGVHINVRPGTATFRNLAEMLDTLNEEAEK